MKKEEYTMNEIFENQILNDLFEIRGNGLECTYFKMYGKPEKIIKVENLENEFVDLINKFIKDKKIQEQILEKFNEYQDIIMEEMNLWNKQYYKLGFLDGMYLKKELLEKKTNFSNNFEDINTNESSFFYKQIDSIIQFIEYNRFHNWIKQENYKKITNQMIKIKDEYPNIRTFFDDRKNVKLNQEELKALLEYISLNESIEKIEKIEIFKLGIKEGMLL